MSHACKITANPNTNEHTVKLLLNGILGEDALPELRQTIADARGARKQVQIDLSEVTLVDRKAVAFLSNAGREVELINCPDYLRRWIRQGTV